MQHSRSRESLEHPLQTCPHFCPRRVAGIQCATLDTSSIDTAFSEWVTVPQRNRWPRASESVKKDQPDGGRVTGPRRPGRKASADKRTKCLRAHGTQQAFWPFCGSKQSTLKLSSNRGSTSRSWYCAEESCDPRSCCIKVTPPALFSQSRDRGNYRSFVFSAFIARFWLLVGVVLLHASRKRRHII